jgi:hypothetical protein
MRVEYHVTNGMFGGGGFATNSRVNKTRVILVCRRELVKFD